MEEITEFMATEYVSFSRKNTHCFSWERMVVKCCKAYATSAATSGVDGPSVRPVPSHLWLKSHDLIGASLQPRPDDMELIGACSGRTPKVD